MKVRITITADRDYDFVQVVDKTCAACLEPVGAVERLPYRLLRDSRDNATTIIDRLPKANASSRRNISSTVPVNIPEAVTVQCALAAPSSTDGVRGRNRPLQRNERKKRFQISRMNKNKIVR